MITIEFMDGRVMTGLEKYIVYENGEIYSKYMNNFLTKSLNRDGYFKTTLYGENKKIQVLVHRIVAELFINNPNPKVFTVVNHKDLNKQNNAIWNLEWTTPKKNNQHAVDNGRRSKTTAVYQFSKDGKFIQTFQSVKEAAKTTKTSYGSIVAAIGGRTPYAGGFFWSNKKEFKPHIHGQRKPVQQICPKTKKILATFDSATEAKSVTGISHISCVCTGERNLAGGFFWEFVQIEEKIIEQVVEEWKDWVILEEYPKYRISKDGKIYSDFRKKIINPSPRGGYIKIQLKKKDGAKITTGVHRLVALAYIPNPYNLPIVNHIDNNGLNNCVDNLEWVTHKGNSEHASKLGLMKGNKKGHKLSGIDKKNSKRVGKFDENDNLLQEYKSIAEAARSIGVDPGNISCVCNGGKQKTAGGFRWKFL